MKFYIFNVIWAVLALWVYISFRIGVDSYLRVKKNGRNFIKKSKKGFLNYWIYKKINTEIGMGYIFYVNILLLILTALYSCMAICLGWMETLSLPVAICNALLCAIQIPAIIFSDIYWSLNYYKKKFVILEKRTPEGGIGLHSSFYAIIETLVLFGFAIYNISLIF